MFRLLLVVFAALFASPALGSDWTRAPGGFAKCGNSVSPGTSCYNKADVDTPLISAAACRGWSLIPYGTGLTVTVEMCSDKSGTDCSPATASPLTGTPPLAWVKDEAGAKWVRAKISGTPPSMIELFCRK